MADDKKIIFSMVDVSKAFPPNKPILNKIYLSFYYGAKIGVIGLNGSGKSTLLKIIAGIEKSFMGEVAFSAGYSVGFLSQEPELDNAKTVKEIVQEGVQPIVDILKEYEEVNNRFAEPMSDDEMTTLIDRQGELTEMIEHHDAWELDAKEVAKVHKGKAHNAIESKARNLCLLHLNNFRTGQKNVGSKDDNGRD